MESKALISELAANPVSGQVASLGNDLAEHAQLGLEAHADSEFLEGVPYVDEGGYDVTPDTLKMRTIDDLLNEVVITIPVVLHVNQEINDVENPPDPPDSPINSAPPTTTTGLNSDGPGASLATQSSIEGFQIRINMLEKGLRDHVVVPLGLTHNPAATISVIQPCTYRNSGGTLMGNAMLKIQFGEQTYYVPARLT